jgi:DNA mismatch repair protein MutS
MLRLRIRLDNIGNEPMAPLPVDPDEMVMDPQTYKDLEIFEGEGGASSLYDLCNSTRSTGGANALKARMRKPWAKAHRIRAVQDSIAFIREHRVPFEKLLSDTTTGTIEQYLNSGLPLVMSESKLQFWIWALEVRFGDFRPYNRILRGVQSASNMVRALRRVAAFPELQGAPGEVGGLITEMRALLDHPTLKLVADTERYDLSVWKVLRLDRTLRLVERATVERLLDIACDLDALVALADTVDRLGWVMPDIVEGALTVDAEDVKHPFIAHAVPNPIGLDQESRRMLFLTGPNMAGKTTYLRSCGIALYLAHLGMGVPARSFRFSPCDRLFSSISVHDNVRAGVSFFRAEALRVKVIAQSVTDGYRVVALMDEPFKGTNVKDALDASQAVLARFAEKHDSLFLVSSHLIELGALMQESGRVDLQHFEASEHEGRLRFEYRLRPGVSTQRLGMRVLREEGIFELLDAETNGKR